jgi:hypothetical protein
MTTHTNKETETDAIVFFYSSDDIPENTSIDEDISGSRTWTYSLRRGNRVSLQANLSNESHMKRILQLHLPLFQHRSIWQRHGYTIDDIEKTLGCFSPLHLWQLGIWERIPTSNSAIRACCASDESMIYGGRAIVQNKLIKLYNDIYPQLPGQQSVLSRVNDPQVPPLPVHRICSSKFGIYKDAMSTAPVDMLKERRIYKHAFFWRNIIIVPVKFERSNQKKSNLFFKNEQMKHCSNRNTNTSINNSETDKTYLMMARIIPRKSYVIHYGNPQSLAMQPQMVTIADEEYCVTEEAFYFVVNEENVIKTPAVDILCPTSINFKHNDQKSLKQKMTTTSKRQKLGL